LKANSKTAPLYSALELLTEREPSLATHNWLKSRAIAFAKGRRAHG
jgi:hypothetical protein